MTYNATPHVNSNRSLKSGKVRVDWKTGKIIPHVTYTLTRAEPRAIDIKRESRILKKLSRTDND